MPAEQRLSEVLTKKLGYYVPISDIGYETVWFYKDEFEEGIFPDEVLAPLADPVHADTAGYTDAEGNYYFVAVVDTGAVEPYEVFMVNNQVVQNFAEGVDE